MHSGTQIFETDSKPRSSGNSIGLVLSGGGSRAAYQVGALRALIPYLEHRKLNVSVIVGSSMGAINGIVLAAALKNGFPQAVSLLESVWKERDYSNTFGGSVSRSLLRVMQIALLRYRSPGPCASSIAIFDPTPLRDSLNVILQDLGGISAVDKASALRAVAVMTTVEGTLRKPLLLTQLLAGQQPPLLSGATFELVNVGNLTACHGLASAALPSVLPAVDLDLEMGQVRLVDGGICDNIPVDPAIRLGAKEIVVIDSSGRRWWFDHYGQPHYTRPTWEVPAAEATFCLCPFSSIECMNISPMGPLLKEVVGSSHKQFVAALGPTWPIFKILKHRMGEALAFEVMSYVALHPDYIAALMQLGHEETGKVLENQVTSNFGEQQVAI